MEDLERIRYVAGHYRSLQGLKTLPFAICFFAVAGLELYTTAVNRLPLWAVLAVYLGGLAVAVVLRGVISRYYYERVFGDVARYASRDGEKRSWLETAATVGLILLGATAFFGDVSAIGFSFILSLVFFTLWWSRRGFGPYYGFVAMMLLVTGFVLMFMGVTGEDILRVVCSLEMGFALLVIGVFDHRLLVQSMRPEGERTDV